MKYRYVIKKHQISFIEKEFDASKTIEEEMEEISNLPEDELNFSEPEYTLDCIIKISGKIQKVIYRQDFYF